MSYEKEDDPRGEHSSGTQEPTLYGRRAQEQNDYKSLFKTMGATTRVGQITAAIHTQSHSFIKPSHEAVTTLEDSCGNHSCAITTFE